MSKKISKVRDIKVGDLVYHILYGKEWVGILLDIINIYGYTDNSSTTHREMAVVRMLPNSQYEYFFEKMVSNNNRITNSMGMVSTNWLFRLELRGKR